MTVRQLRARRRRLARSMPDVEGLISGSVVEQGRRCGKEGCRCASGRTARALHLRGVAPSGGPHPDGVRAGLSRRGGAGGCSCVGSGALARWRRSRRSTSSCYPEESLAEWPWSAEAVAVVANMAVAALEAGGEGNEKITASHLERMALIYLRQSSMAQVREQHRVDRPPIRPGRRGGPAGVGCVPGGGDRRRPGPVGPLRGEPFRVQGSGRPGVSGRGRRHLRSGGVPTGPILGGPVAPVGAGPPDRHAGHRLRWHLRPGQYQRPSRAGPEEPDVRSRAALLGRPAARRQAGRGRAGRAAFPAAGRVRLRRRRPNSHRP